MKTKFNDELKQECVVLKEQLPLEVHGMLEDKITKHEAELKMKRTEYLGGYAEALARIAGQADSWLEMPEFNVHLVKEHVICQKFLALSLTCFIFDEIEKRVQGKEQN